MAFRHKNHVFLSLVHEWHNAKLNNGRYKTTVSDIILNNFCRLLTCLQILGEFRPMQHIIVNLYTKQSNSHSESLNYSRMTSNFTLFYLVKEEWHFSSQIGFLLNSINWKKQCVLTFICRIVLLLLVNLPQCIWSASLNAHKFLNRLSH